MTEAKPIEWWVLEAEDDIDRASRTKPEYLKSIHVIEYSALAAAQKELAELKKSLAFASGDGWNELPILRDKYAKAVEALKYYASEYRYSHMWDKAENTTVIEHDSGHIARQALKELE